MEEGCVGVPGGDQPPTKRRAGGEGEGVCTPQLKG